MFDPPIERLQGLLTRYPGRLHSDACPWTDWLFLNTRVPPFDDLGRAAGTELRGRPRREWSNCSAERWPRATCQVLPPAVPGYRPYCPYTSGRESGGHVVSAGSPQGQGA